MTRQGSAAKPEINLLGEAKEQRYFFLHPYPLLPGMKDEPQFSFRVRRIRNRLSQRTTRERKVAYIRDLEHRLALYETNKKSSRIQELLSENARLRDGLHLARRRMFSISTSINCAADSLKPLLDLEGKVGRFFSSSLGGWLSVDVCGV